LRKGAVLETFVRLYAEAKLAFVRATFEFSQIKS